MIQLSVNFLSITLSFFCKDRNTLEYEVLFAQEYASSVIIVHVLYMPRRGQPVYIQTKKKVLQKPLRRRPAILRFGKRGVQAGFFCIEAVCREALRL
jgi:hypothetical protein